MRNVLIYGVGDVGKAFAYSLLLEEDIDYVYLYDKNKNKIREAELDLLPMTTDTWADLKRFDPKDSEDISLVILTARITNKQNFIAEFKKIIKNKNTPIYVFSNPVREIYSLLFKHSYLKAFPCETNLDTARLKLMGEHKTITGIHGDGKPKYLQEKSKEWLKEMKKLGVKSIYSAVYFGLKEVLEFMRVVK